MTCSLRETMHNAVTSAVPGQIGSASVRMSSVVVAALDGSEVAVDPGQRLPARYPASGPGREPETVQLEQARCQLVPDSGGRRDRFFLYSARPVSHIEEWDRSRARAWLPLRSKR